MMTMMMKINTDVNDDEKIKDVVKSKVVTVLNLVQITT